MGPTATVVTRPPISTMSQVAHSSPQQSTISHSLQAPKSSFPMQSVHAPPSSPQAALPPPHHPIPPPPFLHRHQDRHQDQHIFFVQLLIRISTNHPHSRTRHTSQLPIGSLRSSTHLTPARRDYRLRVPRARCSRLMLHAACLDGAPPPPRPWSWKVDSVFLSSDGHLMELSLLSLNLALQSHPELQKRISYLFPASFCPRTFCRWLMLCLTM